MHPSGASFEANSGSPGANGTNAVRPTGSSARGPVGSTPTGNDRQATSSSVNTVPMATSRAATGTDTVSPSSRTEAVARSTTPDTTEPAPAATASTSSQYAHGYRANR